MNNELVVTLSKYKKQAIMTIALVVATIIYGSEKTEKFQPEISPARHLSSFARSLISEKYDLRLDFLQNIDQLDKLQREGAFLLIPGGGFEVVTNVNTNNYPTVERALRMCAESGFDAHRQVRIIQKNCVLQTPLPGNSDLALRKKVLAISLSPGDIVIVTRVE